MMVAPSITHSNRPTAVLGDPRIPLPFAPRELSLSVRPEGSGTFNTASKRPSAEVALTAPRSRRTGSLHAPHTAPGGRIPLEKPPKEFQDSVTFSDTKKCHTVTFVSGPATKMSQMSQKCPPKSVTFSDTKNMSHPFRIWPARKMSQMSHFSATKNAILATKPCDIVTFQQGVCRWKM